MCIVSNRIFFNIRWNLFLGLFLLVFIFNGIESFSQVKNIHLSPLSIEEGLSQSTVLAIAQDSSGFIWFGTIDGLNRYDGYNFAVYRPDPDDSSSISDNYIYYLYVDRTGKMWVGTNNGLSEYNSDTDNFINYKNDPNNPKSISADLISSITEDESGNLWIGTTNGLNYFNKSTKDFIHYFHNDNDKFSLLSDLIISVFIDSKKRLWVGTDKGMDLFDSGSKSFKHYIHDSNDVNSLIGQRINSIAEDKSGNLWIGTHNGVDRFNFKSNTFIHFRHLINDNESITSDSIRIIYVDRENIIWIGTFNHGLNYYDPITGGFKEFGNSVENYSEAHDRQVRSLLEDKEGLLWIGTFSSGVYKYNRLKESFGLIRIIDKVGNDLEKNDISAIYKDQSGHLWIGSFFAGVFKLNEKTGRFIHYRHTSSVNSLVNNFINVIFGDQKGFIWIGTTEGLDKFNPATNTFYHYKHDQNNINSIGNGYISSIASDNSGNLWLGFFGGGIDKFNPTTNKFIHYKHNPSDTNSLSDNKVNYLFFDNTGTLWIGTNDNGLDRFNIKTGEFYHYVHNENNENSLSNNVILTIYQFPGDTTGTLWIGSAGGGISRFNTKTGQFKNYSEKDGLANNEVYGILGDNKENLWISSNNGISKFNIAEQTFHNYNQSNGLQSNEFNQGSFFQSKDGKMYFGGKSGINAFSPDSIKNNLFHPQVVFTSFKAYNQPVKLKNSIWKTNQITLSYRNDILSLTFAALSYSDPDKNKFAYILEGLNNNWINKGTNDEVTFTNLPPGNYTLLVKGTNNDGIWSNHIASLDIIILPPFWETWWFRSIIIASLIAMIFLIFQFRVKAVKLRNKKLEVEVSNRTKELNLKKEELEKVNFMQSELLEKLTKSETELRDLNKHKDKIISVLAHDLRSPFTGLLGFTDLLANYIDQLETEEIRESAKNIHNVANNLFKLLNNLLDWSRFQGGKIKYSPSDENLLQCVIEVVRLFKVNAEQKSISLNTDIGEYINVWADRKMLDIILRNLISNAIKFTPIGGEVNITSRVIKFINEKNNNSLKTSIDVVEIRVQDNGTGIEEDILAQLLNSNSQISTKGTNDETGTGLGLSLCKELIEKQGGEINIESKVGDGTLVKFTLPKYEGN